MWPDNVRKSDLKIESHRSGGPGGQHKNRRETAIRITHIPTGISAVCTDHRSQYRNRTTAFRRLANKLVPIMKGATVAHRASEITIRTYHELDQRVTDKRVAGKRWRYKDVVHGDGLGEIIDELVGIAG